MMNDPD
jgi:hypothetical protein